MKKLTPRVALLCAIAACTSPLSEEPAESHLAVGGYVTVIMNPAYGVVTLLTPEGLPVSAARIDNGRYEVSWPVEAGTDVCGAYAVLVSITEDQGARSETVQLDPSTGACTMPSRSTLSHRVDVDFPAATGAPGRAPDPSRP